MTVGMSDHGYYRYFLIMGILATGDLYLSFLVLGIEPRALCMRGMCSTTELYISSALFFTSFTVCTCACACVCVCIHHELANSGRLAMQEAFCPGTGITGVCHSHCPASDVTSGELDSDLRVHAANTSLSKPSHCPLLLRLRQGLTCVSRLPLNCVCSRGFLP